MNKALVAAIIFLITGIVFVGLFVVAYVFDNGVVTMSFGILSAIFTGIGIYLIRNWRQIR